MSERKLVRYGNSDIPYSVVRSRRRKKTIAITLDPTEGVLVAAPLSASDETIRALVLKRAGWILSRSDGETLYPRPKLFISGESLPYLGREVRMDVRHEDILRVCIRFTHWAFEVEVPRDLDGDERRERVRAAFARWYRRRALDALSRSVTRWQGILGASPAAVLVRDQRRRWGSCAPDGRLRFNWRIAMAEPALLDYVVVHELAHLLCRNHSGEFWATVEQAMPDFALRRQRLKEVGPGLSF